MGRLAKIEAEVPDHLATGVREAVASGDYASENDVVSDALTQWLSGRAMERISRERLREMLEAARNSGPGEDVDVVINRLKAKYAAMAEAREQAR